MLKFLQGKSKALIGIDISSQSIKVLEIVGDSHGQQVRAYAEALLPPDSVEGNAVKDPDAVGQCLRELLSKHKIATKNVALAVPDSTVISKVIQMNEGLSDSELEELVILEADKYIPYSIDEINIDFEVQGPSAKNSAMVDVLIVASRAENVTTRVDAIAKAGLTPTIVDVESYAIERAIELFQADLPAQGQDKIIAVIDVGSKYTNLFVIDNMKIIFTREEEFGGLQLTQAICQYYKIETEKALKMQKEKNYPENYVSSVQDPFIETLQTQIKRTLQFFYSTSHHSYVDQIFLAGGLARLPNLDTKVAEFVEIPTKVADPFNYLTIGNRINAENLHEIGPSLMVACGLALRHTE